MDLSDNPSPYNWVKEDIEDIRETTGYLVQGRNCLAVCLEHPIDILTLGAQLIYNAAEDTACRTLMILLKSAKIETVNGRYILYFPGILLTDFS